MPDEMAAFGISGAGLREFFRAYPPLDARIRALESAA